MENKDLVLEEIKIEDFDVEGPGLEEIKIDDLGTEDFNFNESDFGDASDFLLEGLGLFDGTLDSGSKDYSKMTDDIISDDSMDININNLLSETESNDNFSGKDIIGNIIKRLKIDENINTEKRTTKQRNEQEMLDLVIIMSNYTAEGTKRELTEEELYIQERMRASKERKERMEAAENEERKRRKAEADKQVAESIRIAESQKADAERKRQEELERLERERLEREESERLNAEKERLERERLEEERRRIEEERRRVEEELKLAEERKRRDEEARKLAEEKRLLEEQKRKLAEASQEIENTQPEIDFDEDESLTYSLEKLIKKDYISDDTII